MSSLSADRESAPVAQTSIRADVHEPFDIHGYCFSQIPLHHPISLNDVPDPHRFVFGQVFYLGVKIDGRFLANLGCAALADTINIGQTNLNPFV